MTLVLLYRFKVSVVRGMKAQGDTPEDGSGDAADGAAGYQHRVGDGGKTRPTLARADRSVLSALVVYLAAGAAFVATFVVADMIEFQRYGAAVVAYFIGGYITPFLFAIWIVLPKGRTQTLGAVAWVAVLVLLNVPAVIAGGPAFEIAKHWLTINGPTALLIWLFMARRVRAAGPLVLTIVGGVLFGVNALSSVAESGGSPFDAFLVLGPTLFMPAVMLVGAVVGLILVMPVLRGLGELHERKFLSDQSLTVDILFLWFAVAYAGWFAVERSNWALVALIAFVLYKLVSMIGFRLLSRRHAGQADTDLLLLRPFSLGRRSEILFDNLSKVWLRIGAVHMIAGPDLVMGTVRPSEFLVFLSGRLSRRFIHNAEDLRAHLDGLDLAPDPDGRHRINQLFCRDNVWRDAMRGLAARSSVILMDLRGFSAANQGCVYELGELIREVAFGRVLFAVDASTDDGYLTTVVEGIRQGLPASSPNVTITGVGMRVVTVDNTAEGTTKLLRALMEGAAV
jgi:hypothetical protein